MQMYDRHGRPIDVSTEGVKQAFVINRNDPPTTKSKDVLETSYHGAGVTDYGTASFAYTVINWSNGASEYTVCFFMSADGRALLATCPCVAWRMCKHVADAWKTHVEAEIHGFVDKLE